MRYQKVYMNHVHSSSLLSQLAQMWRNQDLCDAIIYTGKHIVTKAHRVVLLAGCPVLHTMEDSKSFGTMLEVHLNSDITQEAVNVLLQYLYEGSMLLTEDNVDCVKKVATSLQVESVIMCCTDFLESLNKSSGQNFPSKPLRDKKLDWKGFSHVRSIDIKECPTQSSLHCTNIAKTTENSTSNKQVKTMKHDNELSQSLVKSFPLIPVRLQTPQHTGMLNITPLSGEPIGISSQVFTPTTGVLPQVVTPMVTGQFQGMSHICSTQLQDIQQCAQGAQLTSSAAGLQQISTGLHSNTSKLLLMNSSPQGHYLSSQSGLQPSFAAGSVCQTGSSLQNSVIQPISNINSSSAEQPQGEQPSLDQIGILIKKEPQESESQQEETDSNLDRTCNTYDLSKVKVETDLDDSTGGLTLEVENAKNFGQQLGDEADIDYDDSNDCMSQDDEDIDDVQPSDRSVGAMFIQPISAFGDKSLTSTQDPKKPIKPIRPRFKTATDEELEALEDIPQSSSTKKTTKWGIKCFQEWSNEQYGKGVDFSTISGEDLSLLLCKFYAEAAPKPNKRDEEEMTNNERIYNKNTMKSIRASINRHLRDLDRNIDISRDKCFKRANNILCSKLKREAMLGLASTKYKKVIPPSDIMKITAYLNSKDNPVILRHRVWYNIFSHFSNAGLEINKKLKPQDFIFLHDSDGKEYVSLSPEVCLQHQKPANRQRNNDNLAEIKMYALEDSRSCPVRSLKLLIQKTDASATALFNQVNRVSLADPDNNVVWYTSVPAKNNTLTCYMSEISRSSCCSTVYGAHNLKATASQGIYNLSVKSYTVCVQ